MCVYICRFWHVFVDFNPIHVYMFNLNFLFWFRKFVRRACGVAPWIFRTCYMPWPSGDWICVWKDIHIRIIYVHMILYVHIIYVNAQMYMLFLYDSLEHTTCHGLQVTYLYTCIIVWIYICINLHMYMMYTFFVFTSCFFVVPVMSHHDGPEHAIIVWIYICVNIHLQIVCEYTHTNLIHE